MRARRLLRILGAGAAAVLGLSLAVALVWSAVTNQQIDAFETLDPAEVATGQFAVVQGYRLHYRLSGDPARDATGAPIVLIHGFASSGYEFSKLIPDLAARRSLIVPDLLGYGFSQRVTEPAPAYTHRGQAALLKGLLDQLGVDRADLVGASYGGAIATQFALDYPERVRRIVYLDGQVYDVGGGGFALIPKLPFGLGRALTWNTLAGGPGAAALLGVACVRPERCADATLGEARAKIVRVRLTTEALLAFSSAPRDVYAEADVAKVSQPALVIWGEQDAIVPLERGRRLARELPDARLEVIADAGHTPHLEQPARVTPLVLGFLGAAGR